jgi:hypothetical protein
VVNALVGFVDLAPTLAALSAGIGGGGNKVDRRRRQGAARRQLVGRGGGSIDATRRHRAMSGRLNRASRAWF